MVSKNHIAIEGVLREVDLERGSCQIYPRSSAYVDCSFQRHHESLIKRLLDAHVVATGEPVRQESDGSIRALAIRDIHAVDETGECPADEAGPKPRTGKELLAALRTTGLVGMWQDRLDIGDSSDFARRLRDRAQKRNKA